jgi:hypothetical protein
VARIAALFAVLATISSSGGPSSRSRRGTPRAGSGM